MTFRVADPENPFRDVMLEAPTPGPRGNVAKAMKAKKAPQRTDESLEKRRKRVKTARYEADSKDGSSKPDKDHADEATEAPLRTPPSLAAQSEDISSSFDSPAKVIPSFVAGNVSAAVSHPNQPALSSRVVRKRPQEHRTAPALELEQADILEQKKAAALQIERAVQRDRASRIIGAFFSYGRRTTGLMPSRGVRMTASNNQTEQHSARDRTSHSVPVPEQVVADAAVIEEPREAVESSCTEDEMPSSTSRPSQMVVSVWQLASPPLDSAGQGVESHSQTSQTNEDDLRRVLASAGCEGRGEGWQRVAELGGRTVSVCSTERIFRAKKEPPSRREIQVWFKQLESAKI